MTCFQPVHGYRKQGGGFTLRPAEGVAPLVIPCGGCVGCRLARSQAWAVRLTHEASLHDEKCFVTLTYSDDYLPDDFSVSAEPIQKFMKRLRKRVGSVRFFACGEYGSEVGRPHYHLILFGVSFFSDRKPWRVTGSGHISYISPTLQELWPFGFAEVGDFSVQSAAYVARYVMKKVTGRPAAEYYKRIHPLTGVECNVRPEFVTMSLKPGIGSGWFDKYEGDCFPSDFVVIDGRKYPIPRYYTKKLDEADALLVVAKRRRAAVSRAVDNTDARLAVRQEVVERRVSRLKRELE